MSNDEKRILELQTLKTIAETLNQSNDLKQMLDDVLRKLLHVTGLETGWIYLIDSDKQYRLAADHKLPPALETDNKKAMCRGDCWCIDKFADGRLNKAANIINCKRLEDAEQFEWGETNEITHHATVPLRTGNEKIGLLNVASPNKTHFSTEELALLEAVAFQIGTAMKRMKLVENEQHLALIAERNRLAQDLHDSVNQLLFSIMLTARGSKEMTEDQQMKEMLSYVQDLSQEALSEMRALIWQLRPQGLENGIASALMNYAKVLGLELETDIQGVQTLPCDTEEALWRIGQEALNNCKKHAQIKTASIRIHRLKNEVIMTIKDQGAGFSYNEKLPLPSMGLQGMKNRVQKLNGTFQITAGINRGTEIEVKIPI
ncbi:MULTISPECIES: GAF domain-containing sensor histidine kinase [Metabacillus]|uniref:GAF domain-containing sensor histidine kinase n=1 Tax=Metabacillus hrfriensis TaxID=3048891 RepID=A0ACD4RDQ7_9BACI|nr:MULTISPECIES: GAF domain-containing sensor histidine kinase [Metabacillus]WHZ58542.1 GAF domain-containing sensor histidine kinase [Metabacillus sp. CT-WN-B3]